MPEIPPCLRSNVVVKLRRREAIRVDAGPEVSTREGNISRTPRELTVCRAGDIVAWKYLPYLPYLPYLQSLMTGTRSEAVYQKLFADFSKVTNQTGT